MNSKRFYLLILFGSCWLGLSGCAVSSQTAYARKSRSYQPELAKINIQLGIGYLQKGWVERAKQKLLLAQGQAPYDPAVWYSMGYYQEMTGDLEKAQSSYRRAVQLAPGEGATHNNYGTFLCRHGQYKSAIAQFRRAVNDPYYLDVAKAYENMGLCALKVPNRRQAMMYFRRALQKDARLTTSLFQLAKLERALGQHRQAALHHRRYVEAMQHSKQDGSEL